jgi:UDP:flavonoid glycosyltransferase YjiC (YdhE family)
MVIESAPRTSAAPQSLRRRVLFVGEAVTLAHIVQPVVLAQALDPAQYAITLACDARYLGLFGELPGLGGRSRRSPR